MLYNMSQIGRINRPFHGTCEEFIEPDSKTQESESIASLVFATDPRTGLPSNDIGVYMSDKTHPEIKRYIEEKLFLEVEPTNQLKDDMRDDDAIISAMPLKGETLNQYEARVQKMLNDEKLSRDAKRTEKEWKAAMKKQIESSDE